MSGLEVNYEGICSSRWGYRLGSVDLGHPPFLTSVYSADIARIRGISERGMHCICCKPFVSISSGAMSSSREARKARFHRNVHRSQSSSLSFSPSRNPGLTASSSAWLVQKWSVTTFTFWCWIDWLINSLSDPSGLCRSCGIATVCSKFYDRSAEHPRKWLLSTKDPCIRFCNLFPSFLTFSFFAR
jgi:hypothetical protein